MIFSIRSFNLKFFESLLNLAATRATCSNLCIPPRSGFNLSSSFNCSCMLPVTTRLKTWRLVSVSLYQSNVEPLKLISCSPVPFFYLRLAILSAFWVFSSAIIIYTSLLLQIYKILTDMYLIKMSECKQSIGSPAPAGCHFR